MLIIGIINRIIMSDILTNLADVLEQRKNADADSSYVAKLYSKGLDSILKKMKLYTIHDLDRNCGIKVKSLGIRKR